MGDNDSFLDDKFLEDGFVPVAAAGVGDLLFVALSGGLLLAVLLVVLLPPPGEVIDLNHHDFLVDLGVVSSSLILLLYVLSEI